ncbi:MAG: Trk system potassium transporter TrkA [Gammaproteobacteria bacterium]|nr:MAG: Trk system potassium transporter TrkA [Gammaproteobacteria bacterium]
MKILILGAGQVGGTLAFHLASEQNDITVIDNDMERLRHLQDRIDIRTVNGPASHPSVMKQAGAQDTELLIAVTNSDEVNMVACMIADRLFNIPTRISRIRSADYLRSENLFDLKTGFPVSVIISPEDVVTDYISRLIEYPGALQVLDFAKGKVRLVGIRAKAGGPLVGHAIRHLREHLPNIDTRVAAIYRRERGREGAIIPEGDTVIQEGDEVFFIAAANHIRTVMTELSPKEQPNKRIIIAGGGNIGLRLAKTLEQRYNVKLIERTLTRCHALTEQLSRTIVLHGNVADKEILKEENIEATDVFCAVTNDDEANIMAAMLAKHLGVRKVMALINNPDYVDLIQGGDIDIAISPQQITIGSLLTHVRRGEIENVHSLRKGAAEAIEVVAKGDHRSSKVIGKRLDEVDLPKGATIGAIVRPGEVLIAHDHLRIQPDDHVIIFVVDKSKVAEIERLFAVGLGFF